jgi:hypothetical protein
MFLLFLFRRFFDFKSLLVQQLRLKKVDGGESSFLPAKLFLIAREMEGSPALHGGIDKVFAFNNFDFV